MTDRLGMRGARGERGLTLVELMVVLVFIAIGVLTLSLVQTRSYSDVYATGRQTRALSVAQLQMETARAAGFTLARPDSGVTDGLPWRRDVDSVAAGLRRVTTTVTWIDNGRPQSVRLVSLLSAR